MPAKKKNDDKNSRLQVILAVIGLVGVIGAALIGNMDKWWPKTNSDQNAQSSNTNKSSLTSSVPEVKNRNDAVDPKRQNVKTVALMDNNLLTYDQKRARTGRTNQTEIEDELKDMELRFIHINTNLNWNEYAKLTDSQPDLIIIHVSAFYDKTDPNDKGNKFRTFLANAMPSLPKTKLLVYSRAFQDVTTADVDRYAAAVPDLQKRLKTFVVKAGSEREYFHDMNTSGALRKLVKIMLESP